MKKIFFISLLSLSFQNIALCNETYCDTIRKNNNESLSILKELQVSYHTNNSLLNLSAQNIFAIWSWTSNGTPLLGRQLIAFNLSNIPYGSVVNSAKLYLYADVTTIYGNPPNATFGNNNASTARRITTNWDSATITWNGYITTSLDSIPLPQSPNNTSDYILDVKQFTQYWINNPTQNFGMEFKHNAEGSYYNSLIFHSSKSANVSKRPTLVVCYSAPLGIEALDNQASEPLLFQQLAGQLQFIIPSNTNKIEIMDLTGKLLYKSDLNISNLFQKVIIDNLSLPTSMYFVKTTTKENTTKILKFIVQ